MSAATVTPPAPADGRKPAGTAGLPQKPISWKAPIGYGAVGLLSLVLFGLVPPTGKTSTFTISTSAWRCSKRPAAATTKYAE